jgi:hypothetical protein
MDQFQFPLFPSRAAQAPQLTATNGFSDDGL